MKTAIKTSSIDSPKGGFIFTREGYLIYISYIDPESISEIEVPDNYIKMDDGSIEIETHKEYEYNIYNFSGVINSYENLVKKCIALKYSIEDELSLISKAIEDSSNNEYKTYREFVSKCKEEAKLNYEKLGLIKEDI